MHHEIAAFVTITGIMLFIWILLYLKRPPEKTTESDVRANKLKSTKQPRFVDNPLDWIAIWLRKPTNESDLFGVNIRKTFQTFSPCKHDWYYPREFVRKCNLCGRWQQMAYYRYGSVRTKWVDEPDI